jgi:hypothetical protein
MYSFNYQFEGSSEVRSVPYGENKIDGPGLCNLIVKTLFGNNKPPCQLQVEQKQVFFGDTVTVKRVYAQKFFEEKKETLKVEPVPKPTQRVRRWRSRSPIKRRWRSRSPVYNNYNRVYTDGGW